jgi:hypothetical protein
MMKYMRILRIFGAAIILSLLMAAIPATPVFSAESIILSPTQAKIGDRVNYSGSGYTGSSETNDYYIDIYMSDQQAIVSNVVDLQVTRYKKVADATWLDLDGTYSGYFVLPSTLDQGAVGTSSPLTVASGNTYYIYATNRYYDPATTHKTIKALTTLSVIPGAALDPLSPATGPAGTQVQITGSNFPVNATLVIKYDDTVIPITSGDTVTKSSGILITTITIPSSSTTGVHNVTVTAGTSTVTKTFTVTASATLDALQPASGPAGTDVSISGSSFPVSTPIVFKFDTTTITPSSGDASTRASGIFSSHVTIPQSTAGSHTITVTVGASTASATFTVTGTVSATLSPLSPTSGLAGINVTVNGANFPASTALVFKFDTATLTPTGSTQTDSSGSFTSIITVPSGATAGAHNITVTAGSSTVTAAFTVTGTTTTTPPPPPPSATAININQSGNTIGSLIGIAGTGFKHNSKVTVKYDDNEVATGNTDANGFFLITFQVPPGKHGDHTITANDGTSTNKATFTVESTPPKIPQPLNPQMGVKVKAPVTFDWEDVTDNSSPVTYDLQVASDSDFAGSSLILDKKDIAKSEYTLTEVEELKLAGQTDRLFWRIKAIDAAQNESEWTGAGDFSISQPFKFAGWPLYLTIGVGAVLVFLFGFWMGRRTAFYY